MNPAVAKTLGKMLHSVAFLGRAKTGEGEKSHWFVVPIGRGVIELCPLPKPLLRMAK